VEEVIAEILFAERNGHAIKAIQAAAAEEVGQR